MKLRDEMPILDGEATWFNSNPLEKSDLIGGNPTLFHFWSISCALCKKGIPSINKIRDNYTNELNVVAVHMPRTEEDFDLDQVKEIADAHDISHPLMIDNRHILTNAFNNRHVPAYYVFDSKGKLRHFQAGNGGMRMLEKRVNRVLGS